MENSLNTLLGISQRAFTTIFKPRKPSIIINTDNIDYVHILPKTGSEQQNLWVTGNCLLYLHNLHSLCPFTTQSDAKTCTTFTCRRKAPQFKLLWYRMFLDPRRFNELLARASILTKESAS